jgi:HEAT repeat protein
VAIRRSASDEIRRLVADLSTTSQRARDTATARLSVIGERAVPHLLEGLAASGSAVGRAAILKVLEVTSDRRGVDAALALLKNPGTEPGVALAAVSLVGRCLDSERGPESLEALTRIAVDETAADLLRLASLDVLAGMPARVLVPLRERLGSDPSPAVRARAAGSAASSPPHADPLAALEEAAAGGPADPALLKVLLKATAGQVPLASLHRLVETTRTHEHAARSDLDRSAWQEVRGMVHVALSDRGSRVAVYDLRETLESAPGMLPAAFLSALGRVGDRSCLEAVVGALARATTSRKPNAEWRGQLLATARSIVQREGLTRRHGVVRRVMSRWPDAASDVLARPG